MLVENLKLFLHIVQKGGLAVAGREMGLAPATVSERLSSLEAHYGVRLLTRTTRAISLTDEGKELVIAARRILQDINETEVHIKQGTQNISGMIHISVTQDLGHNKIVPLIDGFIEAHPEIRVNLLLSDGYVDLVGQGIDIALRYGELSDSTMKSRKLCENQRVICAAPSYLEQKGIAGHPDDLSQHNCLIMRFGMHSDHDWPFLVDGKKRYWRVKGNRIANDGNLIRKWCLKGYGLALKSSTDIYDDLRSGRLVSILDEFAPPPTILQMIYPAGAVQPKRIRLFMDYLSAAFKN